jgi:hypothetical protein
LEENVWYVENVSFEEFDQQEIEDTKQQWDCEEGKCPWSFPFTTI